MVETYVPMRFHAQMWLIPVIACQGGAAGVLHGNFRAMTVCSGRPPVSELLLVGNCTADVVDLLDPLIDALLDEVTVACKAPADDTGQAA